MLNEKYFFFSFEIFEVCILKHITFYIEFFKIERLMF